MAVLIGLAATLAVGWGQASGAKPIDKPLVRIIGSQSFDILFAEQESESMKREESSPQRRRNFAEEIFSAPTLCSLRLCGESIPFFRELNDPEGEG